MEKGIFLGEINDATKNKACECFQAKEMDFSGVTMQNVLKRIAKKNNKTLEENIFESLFDDDDVETISILSQKGYLLKILIFSEKKKGETKYREIFEINIENLELTYFPLFHRNNADGEKRFNESLKKDGRCLKIFSKNKLSPGFQKKIIDMNGIFAEDAIVEISALNPSSLTYQLKILNIQVAYSFIDPETFTTLMNECCDGYLFFKIIANKTIIFDEEHNPYRMEIKLRERKEIPVSTPL